MAPPYMPPLYTPPMRARPTRGCIPKVTGMSSATAMVAVSPGMAPTMMPTTVPERMARRTPGFISSESAGRMNSVMVYSPQMPMGTGTPRK